MSTLIYPEQKNEVHPTSEQIKIILEGCKENQRDAQKRLYRIYYSYAMAIALRYSSNYDNAVEMTNDGFLKIYRDMKNFVPRFPPEAFRHLKEQRFLSFPFLSIPV